MDRSAIWLGTIVGTLSVVCLVVGVSYPAPLLLRVFLIAIGTTLLAATLWGIFEWLEILDRRRYYFDGPGGGPDGGEQMKRAREGMDAHGRAWRQGPSEVIPFPRRAA